MICRVCGNEKNNAAYTVLEMMYGLRDEFAYFQCANCKCLQIADIPGNMSRYYPSSYYSFGLDPQKKYKNPVVSRIRRFGDYYTVFANSILGRLVNKTSPNKKLLALTRLRLTKDARILDVGCGSGWRLYALRELGLQCLLGVDPYIAQDIIYENGLRILKASIHDIPGQGAWDVIMYHHSFEHVPDPVEQLRSASRLLSTGGTCLIRIPTVSSWAWEHYREHWVQLDAPRHFFLHSIESMQLLSEKTGFQLDDVVYDSINDQFGGSELYLRGISLLSEQAGTTFTKAQVKRWKGEARKLNAENRGDQAAFYLVKK